MSHQQSLQFVQMTAQHLAGDFTGKRILEIGSYDVNGSTRHLFPGSNYVGADIIPGPGVNVVCSGEALADPDESYDLSLSCECFEHNPRWLETFLNMYRMTRSGGMIVFTCATTGRLEHGTTRTLPGSSPGNISSGCNYYRNLTERDFTSRIRMNDLFADYLFVVNPKAKDLYFAGEKKGRDKIFRFDGQKLSSEFKPEAAQLQARLDAESPYPPILRLASKMALSPLAAAECLPDRQFQNFALAYLTTFSAIRRPLQRLYARCKARRQS